MPFFSSKYFVLACDQPPKSLSIVISVCGAGNGSAGSLAPFTSTLMLSSSGRKPCSA